MAKKAKKALKKVWHFIWEDDSVWSWLVNIVLAFVLIKFMVYPVLGLLFGTPLPIVAVVSDSMEHKGTFDNWWRSCALCENAVCTQGMHYEELNITYEQFRKFSLKNGFNKGDIMVLFGKSGEELKVGDVIVFQAGRPDPIIHRIVRKWEADGDYRFQTKGDNNPKSITDKSLYELEIEAKNIKGKAVLRVPYLGWVKISFVCGTRMIIAGESFIGCLRG